MPGIKCRVSDRAERHANSALGADDAWTPNILESSEKGVGFPGIVCYNMALVLIASLLSAGEFVYPAPSKATLSLTRHGLEGKN